MDFKRIAVVGGGQMGAGIAQVAACAGHDVTLRDISDDFLNRARSTIGSSLGKFVEKGKLTEQAREAALSNLKFTTRMEDCFGADLVVEAVPEDPALKTQILQELGKGCSAKTVLATNTSSISVTLLGRASGRAASFIGIHFMNPVPLMKLVELIRGYATSDETHRRALDFATRLGKSPVTVNDYPGFISNRILMPMLNEAVYALMEGVATKEAIDQVMTMGMNHPMGPLALADFIGLDTCLAIMETLHEGFGDTKYRPCPLLRNMVLAGHLGKKSGRGFYDYARG
ncbi:MAG: 3-hydroxybutyryl-CoA dehydrogenase [Candidatus Wallbacteria bacterium]|nr:3-hydroxybutyryl-CoA dehydrogenase [Candidatus Wallbacteria bacterium]